MEFSLWALITISSFWFSHLGSPFKSDIIHEHHLTAIDAVYEWNIEFPESYELLNVDWFLRCYPCEITCIEILNFISAEQVSLSEHLIDCDKPLTTSMYQCTWMLVQQLRFLSKRVISWTYPACTRIVTCSSGRCAYHVILWLLPMPRRVFGC